MNCTCGGATHVIDSRPSNGGGIRRRRKCLVCGTRFSSIELREDPERDARIAAAIEAAKISSVTLDMFVKAMS